MAEPKQEVRQLNTIRNSTPTKTLSAGICSGFLSTIALQPLEVAKTQMQVNTTLRLPTVFPYVLQTYGVRGFWRGTTPSLYRNVAGMAMFYPMLYTIQHSLYANDKPPFYSSFCLGGGVRGFICLLLCPLNVIKTRFESGNGSFSGIVNAGLSIKRNEGFAALYSGLLPTVIRDLPHAGLHVMFYYEIKSRLPGERVLVDSSIAGVISSFIACFITHPFDVLKTRMQNAPLVYSSVRLTARDVYQTTGASGFYTGFLPRAGRKVLLSAITWVVLEFVVTNF